MKPGGHVFANQTMGRPSYKPTTTQRRQVSIAAGGGMSHEAIAMVLGISRPTLEKHFAHELAGGAFQRRFEALQGLHAAAKKGNVSAVKAYLAATPEFVPELPAKSEPAKPAAVAAPLGKKAAADAAALTAQHGTQWEDLLPGSPVQ